MRVLLLVGAFALLRSLPAHLVFEEPTEFWARVPTMSALAYLFEPWAGYFNVFARLTFLVAFQFGDAGPLVTRVFAAAVIGLVAAYLADQREAIPSMTARFATALAIPVLPIPYPGPYEGPLNSQWWIAIGVLLIALSKPRTWHYPALLVAGLVGIAPCLVVPVFRDRRGLFLLPSAGLQGLVLFTDTRPEPVFALGPEYLVVILAFAIAMTIARLPARTRLAFLYLGLAILVLGALHTGRPLNENWRYLAVVAVGISLTIASFFDRFVPLPGASRRAGDASHARVPPAITTMASGVGHAGVLDSIERQ